MNTEDIKDKIIEQVLTKDYERQYGTNGDDNYLKERIDGAKIFIRWLINKKLEE